MKKVFADIVGQRQAVTLLTAHLRAEAFSHAYLFIGREGSGKHYLAREFSKYILCDKHTNDACGSCHKFDHLSHPDFIYISGDDGIKIDDIREAIEMISLSPVLSRRKVMLISQAENMGPEAANALLKTLEEPPADSVILLTTSSEKRLPETIVSRSQLVKLTPVSATEIMKALERDFDKTEIAKVIDLAEGSIGEAKKLLADKTEIKQKKEMTDDVCLILSSTQLVERFGIIDKYDSKKKLSEFFELFSRAVFGAMLLYHKKEKSRLANTIPDSVSPERLVALARKILKINHDLQYNVSLRVAFEEMMLKDIINA